MKKLLTLAAGLVAGTTLMMSAAYAGPVHVDLNIGIPLPVFVQPAPVYYQPEPVYVQPRAVYYGYRDYGWYQRQRREHEWHDRREWQEHHGYDRDYRDERRVEHHEDRGYH
ncbi:PXPV repeat protein [Solimicrobium silvestre]|uniref:PXPV repeat (3 copies) n=1 Tax=Solimicrobium silvestre TaxID=2099400 RepID=A0A2S9GVR3_9BURK|nr:PXPV repeat protein [Solimicrobium silvestre]PRC91812.1 hypothetical protein S2091_3567 [Solimicrobium silvestre]